MLIKSSRTIPKLAALSMVWVSKILKKIVFPVVAYLSVGITEYWAKLNSLPLIHFMPCKWSRIKPKPETLAMGWV